MLILASALNEARAVTAPCARQQGEGGGLDTTIRDESHRQPSQPTLCLEWVWPSRQRVRLQGAKLSIGRDPSANLHIDGSGVSRLHAELYRQGPLYVVRDSGSTNGTWLKGRRIEHAPVAPGSVLRIGSWIGVFTLLSEDAPSFAQLSPGVFGGPELAELMEPLKRVATTTLPIALVGPTGSGKEGLARAVHHFSGRSGPLVAVNCAAIPEHLAEAELFGYRRGAFTGAERASAGHFRAAQGGTLFLDEVGELSLAMQAKLLRAVETRQVQGLGEEQPSSLDVRFVTAAQRPFTELVAERRFREDLAARLSGLELRIPRLAERRADVAPLFAQFLKDQSGGRPPEVEPRLIEALCNHDWPQNVRELELLARTLLALHGHEPRLAHQHLPSRFAHLLEQPASSAPPAAPAQDRREHDRRSIEQELSKNGGNVQAAARALGISRQRVYRVIDPQAAAEPGKRGAGDDSAN